MPNNIQLFKNYIDLLDTVYKQASLTAILDSEMCIRDSYIEALMRAPYLEK